MISNPHFRKLFCYHKISQNGNVLHQHWGLRPYLSVLLLSLSFSSFFFLTLPSPFLIVPINFCHCWCVGGSAPSLSKERGMVVYFSYHLKIKRAPASEPTVCPLFTRSAFVHLFRGRTREGSRRLSVLNYLANNLISINAPPTLLFYLIFHLYTASNVFTTVYCYFLSLLKLNMQIIFIKALVSALTAKRKNAVRENFLDENFPWGTVCQM